MPKLNTCATNLGLEPNIYSADDFRSFIQDVISGKKNIILETLDRFRVLFPRQLEKFEHFRNLVLRDQSKSNRDRSYYEAKIQFESTSSHAELDRKILKQFHARMLELAREASEFPFNERILNASTVLLSEEELNEMREKIFKFKEAELQCYQLENGLKKRVYQVQFAVFPLTKPLGT